MSLWKKPLGPAAAERANRASPPVSVEIIADQLMARVYQHEIATQHGPLPCWSYVTDGMTGQLQSELVFTLRRDPDAPGEPFPDEPLQLFAAIYQLAEQGQRVTAGSTTQFGAETFFGHHALYVRAQPLAGVALPSYCLAVLLVTPDELRAAREFGPTRVLARMGQAISHYPFPPWADPRRRGLSLERTFASSLLTRIPRASTQTLQVVATDQQIAISALRSEQPAWQDRLAQVPAHMPLALLTSLDPAANGCMVWVPGQDRPEAIAPPGSDGSRVCGCFIVFIPEQAANAGRLLEDGFAMELTRDAWQALRSALIEGKDLEIPAQGDGFALRLTWRDEIYVTSLGSPAELAEPGGSSADGATPAAGRPVRLGDVRLLTALDQVAQRTSLHDLARFCRDVELQAARVLGAHPGPLELLLRVRCSPEGYHLDLARIGEVAGEALQAFLHALQAVPRLAVAVGEVVFEIELLVAARGDA